jgi:NAD+-dependent protein deacetylase sirtuin 6
LKLLHVECGNHAAFFLECRGKLKDMVLDWDDALPEDQLEASEEHARDADLVICLGTSLQIRPICNLPNVAKRHGGRVAIVNLQKTPKNKLADVVIHGKCDEVMQQVMQELQRPLPLYERWDRFEMRVWRSSGKKRKADGDADGEVRIPPTPHCRC